METYFVTLFLALLVTMCYFAFICRVFSHKKNGVVFYADFSPKRMNGREYKGYECELRFNKVLSNFIGKDEYLFSNVVFKEKKEIICEIDSILVSRRGIFCIEIKSHQGTGKGGDSVLHWKFRQNPNKKTKSSVDNPVIQNKKHCDIFDKTFNNRYISKNIVVFPNALDLSKIKSNKVFGTDGFLKYYKSLKENQLSRQEVKDIVNKLTHHILNMRDSKISKRLTKEQMLSLQLS